MDYNRKIMYLSFAILYILLSSSLAVAAVSEKTKKITPKTKTVVQLDDIESLEDLEKLSEQRGLQFSDLLKQYKQELVSVEHGLKRIVKEAKEQELAIKKAYDSDLKRIKKEYNIKKKTSKNRKQLDAEHKRLLVKREKTFKYDRAGLKKDLDSRKTELVTKKAKIKTSITDVQRNAKKWEKEYSKRYSILKDKHNKDNVKLKDLQRRITGQVKQEIAKATKDKKTALDEIDKESKKQSKKLATESAIKKSEYENKKKIEDKNHRKRKEIKSKSIDRKYKEALAKAEKDLAKSLKDAKKALEQDKIEIDSKKKQNRQSLKEIDKKIKITSNTAKGRESAIKKKYKKDKAKITANYNKRKKGKVDKKVVEREYKREIAKLESEYKSSVAAHKRNVESKMAQFDRNKNALNIDFKKLESQKRKHLSDYKVEVAGLKKYPKAGLQAKFEQKKKDELAKLEKEHVNSLDKIKAEYDNSFKALKKADSSKVLALEVQRRQVIEDYTGTVAKAKKKLADLETSPREKRLAMFENIVSEKIRIKAEKQRFFRETKEKRERERLAEKKKDKEKRDKKDKANKEVARIRKSVNREIEKAKKERATELANLDKNAQKQKDNIQKERKSLKDKLISGKKDAEKKYDRSIKGLYEKNDIEKKNSLERIEVSYNKAVTDLRDSSNTKKHKLESKKRDLRSRLTKLETEEKSIPGEMKAKERDLKEKYEKDRSRLIAEYKKKKKSKQYKKEYEKQHKRKMADIKTSYERSVALLKKKANEEKKRVRSEINKQKNIITTLNAQVREIAKDTNGKESKLRNDFEKDKAKLIVEMKDSVKIEELKAKRGHLSTLSGLERKYYEEIAQLELEKKEKSQIALLPKDREQVEAKYRKAVAAAKAKEKTEDEISLADKLGEELPENIKRQIKIFAVKKFTLSENTLISEETLLANMPLFHNSSDKEDLAEVQREEIYDLTVFHELLQNPGEMQQVSTRAMEGLTRYIVSAYNDRGYAGIHAFVVADDVNEDEKKIKNDTLDVKVLEAKISDLTVTYREPTGDPDAPLKDKDTGYLRPELVKQWSPVKKGTVANKTKIDEFTNLLNLNPDRYVSTIISRGSEDETLELGYEIAEVNPTHFYLQVDNSGTKDRQWVPKIGMINTNLTGGDDRFSLLYQAPVDSPENNYSLLGSYEIPIFTPQLRLNLYAGYSDFDITPQNSEISFLGNGSFYGGILRLNVLQFQTDDALTNDLDNWFVDITSSLSHENSKVSPSLFPTLGYDLEMDMLGVGLDVHKSDPMSSTSVTINKYYSKDTSSLAEFNTARVGTDDDFSIFTLSAVHSQYLDTKKVHRISGLGRWVNPEERLVPSKMTTFGGLYSVRGYHEDEIVADGGWLFSAQYEYDIIASVNDTDSDSGIQKLALIAFTDIGRARIESPEATEKEMTELFSIGAGASIDFGNGLEGTAYYGFPMKETDDTEKGKGRWNFSVLLRW